MLAIWEIIFAVLILSVSTGTLAAESECEKLHAVAQEEPAFHPPLSAKVVGQGRAQLYSAPHTSCAEKQFLIPSDHVTVYVPYKKWFYVMYVNGKTGEDYELWVRASRLKITGKYGP